MVTAIFERFSNIPEDLISDSPERFYGAARDVCFMGTGIVIGGVLLALASGVSVLAIGLGVFACSTAISGVLADLQRKQAVSNAAVNVLSAMTTPIIARSAQLRTELNQATIESANLLPQQNELVSQLMQNINETGQILTDYEHAIFQPNEMSLVEAQDNMEPISLLRDPVSQTQCSQNSHTPQTTSGSRGRGIDVSELSSLMDQLDQLNASQDRRMAELLQARSQTARMTNEVSQTTIESLQNSAQNEAARAQMMIELGQMESQRAQMTNEVCQLTNESLGN